jgi:hypothetical protein
MLDSSDPRWAPIEHALFKLVIVHAFPLVLIG